MKIKHLIPTALAAIVAIAAPAAHAARTYTSGDLYLGIRQVGNNTSDFAVNIGAGYTYRDALAPITLTLTNLTTTLNGIFGTNWATNSSVYWGVVGTTQTTQNTSGLLTDPIRLVYASEPVGNPAPTSGGQTAVANSIRGMEIYYQTTIPTEAAVNNSAIGSPGEQSSWTYKITTGNPFSYNNFAPLESVITTNLELYRMPNNGTVTNEGTFSLSGDTLTFTPVPEASTYAFWFMGAAGLVVVGRRYFRKTSAV